METKKERKHLFDNPRNVKRVIHILYAVSAISLAAEFFIERKAAHPWEGLFGFYGLYGFAACVLLVLIAKEMRKAVMRKDDYYDD